MKATLLLVLVVAAVAVASRADFDNFLHKYGKAYSGLEYQRRLNIFESNLRKAAALNEDNGSPAFGISKFSDLTEEEFQSTMLMQPVAADVLAKACLAGTVYAPAPADPPASYDWRSTPNVVLSVKDQGSCGSCWAFSTVENIEGQNGIANNAMAGIDLSPQYIVDCSKGCSSEWYNGANTTVCNGGCNGGWPWTAFDDLSDANSKTKIGGVPSLASYPYTGITGKCKATTGNVATISSYTCFTDGTMQNLDEKAMAQDLVTYGPLSIALNANYFQTYTGGIMNIKICPTNYLNHAVLLVGYGTDSGTDYWIVKNSWGPAWGEQGYIRIARGKGMCGINEAVSTARL